MAGPNGATRRLIAETEYHIASLDELLAVYELALENELKERRKNTRLIATLAARIEYTAEQLAQAKYRRQQLQMDLQ